MELTNVNVNPSVRIDYFDGKFAFLSNFYPTPVNFDGVCYPNNEAAFQAQKCPARRDEFIKLGQQPGKAKRLGREVELRPNWDQIKDDIMYALCLCKFVQNPHLADMLIATGDAELVEGNYWRDRYWGVAGYTIQTEQGKALMGLDKNDGQNKLGKILMKVRAELIAGTAAKDHKAVSGVFYYGDRGY